MQKLSGRKLIGSARDILSHVPGNCGRSLNSPEERDSRGRVMTQGENSAPAVGLLWKEDRSFHTVYLLTCKTPHLKKGGAAPRSAKSTGCPRPNNP